MKREKHTVKDWERERDWHKGSAMLGFYKRTEEITDNVDQKFCNISVWATLQCIYNITEEVQAIVGIIVEVNVLIDCTLFNTTCDIKTA